MTLSLMLSVTSALAEGITKTNIKVLALSDLIEHDLIILFVANAMHAEKITTTLKTVSSCVS